jgi:hypothetical protein
MPFVAFNLLQVFEISGIGELIKIDQADVLMLFQHIDDKIGANESGTAGHKIGFHNNFVFPFALQ